MGVIYSPEQVAAGRVPTADKIALGALSLREGLQELVEQGLVKHATIHGSVVEGRHTARSDIDAHIVYSDRTPAGYESVVDICDAIQEETGAVIETTKVPASFSPRTLMLGINDPIYAYYLSGCMQSNNGWTVGGPHVSYIEAEGRIRHIYTNVRMLHSYIFQKSQKFSNRPASHFDADERATFNLQRALELPRAIARKVRQCYRYDQEFQRPEIPELLGVLALQGFLPPDEDVLEALTDLYELDMDMTNVIDSLARTEPDATLAEDYRQLLITNYEVALPRARYATVQIAEHMSGLSDYHPHL